MIENLKEHKILPVICGPTASGKTSLSIKLADKIDCEIISADSRQVFKYMDIGTAKPDKEELKKVKHHFIDSLEPDKYFSAGLFGEYALDIVNQIYSRNKLPIVVGGSGLYIKALCDGFFEDDPKNNQQRLNIRENLENRLVSEGKEDLYEELLTVDLKAARLYPDMNPRRVIRALEYYYLTGKKYSEERKNVSKPKFNCLYYGISHDRETLYDRINRRCEIMIEDGLVDETSYLINRYDKSLNSLNSVGYKEITEFLERKISIERALELMQRNTRHFAKRQLTWFRSYDNLRWIDSINDKAENLIIEDLEYNLEKLEQ